MHDICYLTIQTSAGFIDLLTEFYQARVSWGKGGGEPRLFGFQGQQTGFHLLDYIVVNDLREVAGVLIFYRVIQSFLLDSFGSDLGQPLV
jgi:hypothetical protein